MTDDQSSEELIQEAVLSTVERLEDEPPATIDDLDPLDITVEASFGDGSIKEITAVTTTGGPHIEVDLFGGTVSGWWGGDHHDAPILDDAAEAALHDIGDRLEQQWEDVILA